MASGVFSCLKPEGSRENGPFKGKRGEKVQTSRKEVGKMDLLRENKAKRSKQAGWKPRKWTFCKEIRRKGPNKPEVSRENGPFARKYVEKVQTS